MPVSIDIVPVEKLKQYDANEVVRFTNTLSLYQCENIGSYLYESSEGNLYTSLLENRIIKLIPGYVRMGYKIAKAVRLSSLLLPIFPQLRVLGLTDDIHNIIRTYMLKSCVFYLINTWKLKNKCNKPTCWDIAIYGLLKYCLVIRELWKYFGNGPNIVYLFRCEHQSRELS